jgi:hypothetical protein
MIRLQCSKSELPRGIYSTSVQIAAPPEPTPIPKRRMCGCVWGNIYLSPPLTQPAGPVGPSWAADSGCKVTGAASLWKQGVLFLFLQRQQ